MTVQTRYLNVDAWGGGLDHKLELIPDVLQHEHTTGLGTLQTGYWACDVGVRHSDGSETAIASKIAQVSKNAVGWTYLHEHWDCPSTPLVATDAIVVRVYGRIGAGAWVLQGLPFLTEQLGAGNLDAANWTIWYNVRILFYSGVQYQYLYYHDIYISEDFESEIDNFTWSPPAPTTRRQIMDGFVFADWV